MTAAAPAAPTELQPMISSRKFGTVISWKDEPYQGRPLTRTWLGTSHDGTVRESRSGDTPGGRDREIAALVRDNDRHGHDWEVGY